MPPSLAPVPLRGTTRLTGRNTADVGTLTHLLISSHVDQVHSTQFTDSARPGATVGTPAAANLLNQMFAVAYDLIGANPNATRVLATEAASLACRYLTDFVPDPSWRLLGVEYDTGAGHVDLAWVHVQTDIVFYDEIKTSRVTNARVLPASWVSQVRRYSTAGTERHEDRFLGTRLIPVMAVDAARLIAAHGAPMLLASTAPKSTAQTAPAHSPAHSPAAEASDTSTPTQRTDGGRRLTLVRGVR